MYKVGTKLVYPAYGVTTLTRIEIKELGGKQKAVYVLKVDASKITLIVKVNDAATIGVRPIVNETEAKSILNYISSGEVEIETGTWNKRYRQFLEEIKSGNIEKIATVFKKLKAIQSKQELSFGERCMLNTSRDLLVSEIGLALNLSPGETNGLLEIAS